MSTTIYWMFLHTLFWNALHVMCLFVVVVPNGNVRVVILGTCDCYFIWQRLCGLLTDWVKTCEMVLTYLSGPYTHSRVFLQVKGRGGEDTCRGKAVWGRTRITAVALPQGQEDQQPPAPPEARNGLSPRASTGSRALPAPSCQPSGLRNCDRISFGCFKPPSLW